MTQTNVHDLVEHLLRDDVITEANNVYRILVAVDGIANTAIWLVVPMTYIRNIHLDIRELTHTDFKTDAEEQYGGSLNMVLIYLEYFAANLPVTGTNTNRACNLGAEEPVSAMRGSDNYFSAIVEAKLELRVFSRHLYANRMLPSWLGVPIISILCIWENGKNKQSHQDPTFCEDLLGEMTDVSRGLCSADWNNAIAALQVNYSADGQIWILEILMQPLFIGFTPQQTREVIKHGTIRLRGSGRKEEQLLLVATAGDQLAEVLQVTERLEYAGINRTVIYLQESSRFHNHCDEREAECMIPTELINDLFPLSAAIHIFLTYTRPEPCTGLTWALLQNNLLTPVLDYINQGDTLDELGMLFSNKCSWLHVVIVAVGDVDDKPEVLLNKEEFGALTGKVEPTTIFNPDLRHVR